MSPIAEIIKQSPIYIRRGDAWWIPRCPSAYQGGIQSLVSDVRNVDGSFRGDEIRNELASCSFSFAVIFANELSELLKCFSKRFDGRFVNEVRFLDVVSDEYVERQMYVGDRDAQLYSMAVLSGGQKIYTDVQITLSEV